MRYDTVIIGAGLSGLAAGIRLAYFDRSVCVLERHTTVGGLNSFYRLRDRNHDVGLHAVTNYAAPGTLTGPLSKLLRQLRLRWEDFALVPQTQSSIVFPDCTLRFTNDFEYFEQQVIERFPAEKDNFARLVQRIAEYNPSPSFHEYWRPQVDAMALDPELRAVLLDEGAIDEALATLPASAPAGNWHACTHTTFSPNVVTSQTKTNIIPDVVDIDVDIRTLPGETHEDVEEHLRHALGDIYDQVSVEVILEEPSTQSQIDTPLWDSMQRAVANPFPTSRIAPTISVGFTDARVHRDLGAVAYGAGLLSPTLTPAEFGSRFHGHNERIDLESLDLTTRFYHDVVRDLLG